MSIVTSMTPLATSSVSSTHFVYTDWGSAARRRPVARQPRLGGGLTDSSTGSKDNSYDYDPYGVILHETTGVPNPFQYAGDYFESSTGLVKFGTRYYNPALGRRTQQDPVGGRLGSP